MCVGFIPFASHAADWPQWLGPRRDSVWTETGILDKFPTNGPVVRWRAKVGGGFSGPAVANGRVYLMDRQLAGGAKNPSDPFARGSSIPGTERVLCLNEADGTVSWHHDYDCPYTISYASGPRATPTVSGGKVYALGAEGQLHCLDAMTGKLVWSRDFKTEFGISTPVWGFAGHPLVDGGRLICLVGGDGSTAVAFDKETGKELWRSLTAKEPGYCPPTMIEVGGKPQVVIWHPESVNGLDPDTGKLLWSVPSTVRSGLTIPTPRQVGNRLFITSFYDGSLMLDLNGKQPEVIWRSKKSSEKDTDGLHAIMCTPFVEAECLYGVCSYGQLRCLKVTSGDRVWESLTAATNGQETRWGNAFIVKNGGRFFLFNEKGDIIIARLTPGGYEEISRAHLIDPTNSDPGRPVVWSHPAFANRCIFARNDLEIVCASLAAR